MNPAITYPNFKETEIILCFYANTTKHIQVVRISNILNFYYEKVVFPGQRLMFETVPEAILEVFTGSPIETLLFDRILCDRLRVETSLEPQSPSLPSFISEPLKTYFT